MAFLTLIDKSNCQQCGETVAAFYHHSQGVSLKDFQLGCLQTIQAVIPQAALLWQVKSRFDGAQEKEPSQNTQQAKNHSSLVTLVAGTSKSTQEASLNQLALQLETLPLSDRLHSLEKVESLGFGDEPVMKAMAASLTTDDSNLVHQFVFVPQPAFTELQQQELQLYLKHLLEAFDVFTLSRLRRGQKQTAYATAICNAKGQLLDCCDAFGQFKADADFAVGRLLEFGQPGFVRQADVLLQVTHQWGFYALQAMVVPDALQGLTDKELQLCFYLKGLLSNQQIAEVMGISRKTVENHLGNIYRKLGQISRSELFVLLNE